MEHVIRQQHYVDPLLAQRDEHLHAEFIQERARDEGGRPAPRGELHGAGCRLAVDLELDAANEHRYRAVCSGGRRFLQPVRYFAASFENTISKHDGP